jgi:hypothetical protein
MKTRLVLLAATFLAVRLDIAVAETPSPAPPALPPPPVTWGWPAADVTGSVRMFKLTPIGELEGLILSDGTEVHLPPHLTQQLAAAVRLGDPVLVRGWRPATPGFVVGTGVTDMRSGRTITDQGPPPPGMRPPPPPPGQPAPGAQWASVQGRVQQDLHGPAGDINGAVLDNGTELKLPPPAAYQVSDWLQPGQTVVARGYLLSNTFGRVLDIQEIGPSADRLAQVGWVAPPGRGIGPPTPSFIPPPPLNPAYAPPTPVPAAPPPR